MFGSDITKLQTQLKNYGFDEIGEIDGYYGSLSEKISKRQKNHILTKRKRQPSKQGD